VILGRIPPDSVLRKVLAATGLEVVRTISLSDYVDREQTATQVCALARRIADEVEEGENVLLMLSPYAPVSSQVTAALIDRGVNLYTYYVHTSDNFFVYLTPECLRVQ
jgi:hypothetical protein